MNRWHVYECIKQIYTVSGELPTEEQVKKQFPNILPEELLEGFTEFNLQLNFWGSDTYEIYNP